MKNLFVVVVGMMAGMQMANATSPMHIDYAALDRMTIDANHTQLVGAIDADVRVNHSLQKITLRVTVPSKCPADHACVAVVPPPVVIELDIFRQFEDSCGSYHYEALSPRPVAPGSVVESLEVTDNTNNRCLTYVALPATEVRYETTAGYPGFPAGLSIFTGDQKLQ